MTTDELTDAELDAQLQQAINDDTTDKDEEKWERILQEVKAKHSEDWEAWKTDQAEQHRELMERLQSAEADRENLREELEALKQKDNLSSTEPDQNQELEVIAAEVAEVEPPESHEAERKRRKTIF
jgi:hypothetical protein